ncbi:Lysosomal Pro-X carboxypeptidase [Morella rubra]|uniref:Lysosomal Pro-X carboxypeptidase n=1 Tax=Morella rubra TaxID=262757 RepID=A0A6A1WQ09_9ROSI|nr:Lysosomal Pro-X carboxypeptidase [Morella rubra]
MNSPTLSLQWLFFVFLIFSTLTTSTALSVPRLSPIRRTNLEDPETAVVLQSASVSDGFQTFYYDRTLDHFNYRPESYTTFQQRYVINSKHWGGANISSPIFAYLGAEGPLGYDLSGIGFLNDNAAQIKALSLYIEHRYYGESIPFGSREEALRNASTLGYFNSDQAIADYAAIIMHTPKQIFPARDFLQSMYATAAQYNMNPPKHPRVTTICGGIDGAPSPETDILGKIFAGVVAYLGEKPCYVDGPRNISETTDGWGWQDIKLIPHRFGSNIIFSNGLKDPWSSGGELGNISHSIVAVSTVNGSNYLDMHLANKSEDPEWLVMQQQVEVG